MLSYFKVDIDDRGSLFLGFIRFPQLVLCGSYDGITTRPNRGQTGQPRGEDSRVLGFYFSFLTMPTGIDAYMDGDVM